MLLHSKDRARITHPPTLWLCTGILSLHDWHVCAAVLACTAAGCASKGETSQQLGPGPSCLLDSGP